MKQMKYFLALSLVAILSIGFWSCDPEVIDPVEKSKLPTLAISSPQSLLFDVTKGEKITFHIEASANANTKTDLKEVSFNATYSAGGSWDTVWNVASADGQLKIVEFDYEVPATVSDGDVITITVSVKDEDALVGTKIYTLNVKDLSGLNTYDGIVLGAQSNATVGSFFATSTKTIFLVDDAKLNGQSTIDFVYFYGDLNTATIASPDNDDVFGNGVGKISSLLVQEWTTRNATRFRKIAALTSTEWDVLTATRIAELYTVASQPIEKMANYLSDGSGGGPPSFVVFKTAKNKYGIFKVKDISSYDKTGTITLDIKVKK